MPWCWIWVSERVWSVMRQSCIRRVSLSRSYVTPNLMTSLQGTKEEVGKFHFPVRFHETAGRPQTCWRLFQRKSCKRSAFFKSDSRFEFTSKYYRIFNHCPAGLRKETIYFGLTRLVEDFAHHNIVTLSTEVSLALCQLLQDFKFSIPL